MRFKAVFRISVIILTAVMMASAVSGTVIYDRTGISDGTFYTGTHSSSSMSGIPIKEISLGAMPLPGHRIVEDYSADVLVRSQQYNFKSIIMILVIFIMLSALFGRLFEKSFSGAKKMYRLLI